MLVGRPDEAGVVLVDVELPVEAEILGVGAQEALDVGLGRQHVELGGDRGFRNPAHLFGCGCRTGDGRAGFRRRAHLGSDGCEGDPEALDPVTEVRRRAHADLLTEGP